MLLLNDEKFGFDKAERNKNPKTLDFMMKANSLIFNELLKRGYNLEGKTRVWNVFGYNLCFLTPEQVEAYANMQKYKIYWDYMYEYEANLIKKHLPEIIKEVLHGSPINIIDISSFDGRKAIPIIEALHKKAKMRYCPLDALKPLTNMAVKNMKKLRKAEVIKFKWNVTEFDDIDDISALMRDKNFRENLFLFLGSVISNFDPYEITYHISEGFDKNEDFLLLGVALANKKPEEVIAAYKNEYMDKFLWQVMKNLGFERNEVEQDVRYKNNQVEIIYNILADKKIMSKGKTIYFQKGDKVIVCKSARYKESEIRNILKEHFKSTKFYFNNDKSWALVLCSNGA